ncbi:2-oxoacid dehydrogenases acyltransferase (catalytic domain) [Abditibacterium utsteinense]|uniref:2-oxoacid dehydrogenases acyltransferase (Catalytic domain) n=1 Tax=Abditibacterium utsteinense TaxID=1960156 RepID=A0A2S8SR20_9BACT|nr:2-oxo acid dehydrogenase subunit E2 [Abditibacterium utsteinense]PQV63247.1 2-oxoacid dehydrogenases acyltransferase (catalytic domain) [Abditibacterium utsteinense]
MPAPTSFSEITEMDGAQRALLDILSSVRRPDGYCCTLVDFSRAEAFRRQRIEETGVPITLIDMTLRAMAITAIHNEPMKTLVSGYKIYRSEGIDIGCSIATDTLIAPVIVFRDAQNLTLEEIHFQRLAMTKSAVEEQEKNMAQLAKMTRFLPDGVRRRLINKYVNNAENRKNLGGTIALSAIELDDMEWMCPAHIGGAMLLSLGGIKARPIVVDGQVEARLCALATFMIDQRVIHPMRAMRVFRRFRRALENPQKMV